MPIALIVCAAVIAEQTEVRVVYQNRYSPGNSPVISGYIWDSNTSTQSKLSQFSRYNQEAERGFEAVSGYKRFRPPNSVLNCVGYVSSVVWKAPKFTSRSANDFYTYVIKDRPWSERIASHLSANTGDIVVFIDRISGRARHIAVVYRCEGSELMIMSKNEEESVFMFSHNLVALDGYWTVGPPHKNWHYAINYYRIRQDQFDVQIIKPEPISERIRRNSDILNPVHPDVIDRCPEPGEKPSGYIARNRFARCADGEPRFIWKFSQPR